MKKQDLVDAVAESTGMQKSAVENVINSTIDAITKAMAGGDDVALTGFGTFRVSKRAARMGVNPKTGEKIQIAAATVPKFKAGKLLKEAVK